MKKASGWRKLDNNHKTNKLLNNLFFILYAELEFIQVNNKYQHTYQHNHRYKVSYEKTIIFLQSQRPVVRFLFAGLGKRSFFRLNRLGFRFYKVNNAFDLVVAKIRMIRHGYFIKLVK